MLQLKGQRFGRLIAIERMPPENHRDRKWKCLCDCGKETFVVATQLKSGNTKSCGCLNVDQRHLSTRTHGQSHTKTHMVWSAMRQ